MRPYREPETKLKLDLQQCLPPLSYVIFVVKKTQRKELKWVCELGFVSLEENEFFWSEAKAIVLETENENQSISTPHHNENEKAIANVDIFCKKG